MPSVFRTSQPRSEQVPAPPSNADFARRLRAAHKRPEPPASAPRALAANGVPEPPDMNARIRAERGLPAKDKPAGRTAAGRGVPEPISFAAFAARLRAARGEE
jgi:hypothetical protein